MAARLVLFGYGNPSRGDDALGPALLAFAEAWAQDHPGTDLRRVEDFQLQIEHAMDLQGRDLALFLDADAACTPPFAFHRAGAEADDSLTTHALSPGTLLSVARAVLGGNLPQAYILSVRGRSFRLGAPLSPSATAHLDAAWTFLEGLLETPDPATWAARAEAWKDAAVQG